MLEQPMLPSLYTMIEQPVCVGRRLCLSLKHLLCRTTSVEEGETIIKTSSDHWIVGKKSDQREFYVILNQKNATLTQINGEFNRGICRPMHKKKLCITNIGDQKSSLELVCLVSFYICFCVSVATNMKDFCDTFRFKFQCVLI